MENLAISAIKQLPIQEIMTMSEAFAASGMFPDVNKAGQAMVKIIAGQEIGIPPFQAMNGIHIIKGKTTLGAGIIASRVKGSGKYDYAVNQLDEKACNIDFFEGKKKIGNSTFTIEDAKKAGTQNLDKHTRNMLFARAISNGVKWYCPDVFTGPVYVPEEMENITTIDTDHTDVTDTIPSFTVVGIGSKAFKSALTAMKSGKSFEDVESVANGSNLTFDSEDVKNALLNAVEEAA